ncbi:AMP-binding protein, partial [Virgibacillus salexigens]|uniref:AMP-binding protein n=1 Tax=Virgibacillus massiliensis TaxID=1462526 RepID=UPI0018E0D43D
EMSYIIKNGDVKAIITMDNLLEKFKTINDQFSKVNHYIVCDSHSNQQPVSILQENSKSFTAVLKLGSPHFTGPVLEEDTMAIILYTSGTTGTPKGAMLSHKTLYSNAKDTADYLQIIEHDRVIAALPMFHV